MTNTLAGYLFLPLLLTIVIEEVVGILLDPEPRFLRTILMMNLVTNPLMNLSRIIFYHWWGINYGILAVLEAAVWLYEAEFIKVRHPYSRKRAMVSSLLLNGSSFLIGYVLGWKGGVL